MDFAFSEEQQMLAGQVKSFLGDRFSADRVAELAESEAGWDPGSWPQIAELGLLGLSASEAAGGAGMSFLDEAVVIEEMGAALYPGPYLSSVALAQPALEANPELLADLVAGKVAATYASVDALGSRTQAATDDAAWRLSGKKILVPDLGAADILVVSAASPEGTGLWALRKEDAICSEQTTMDSTRRYGSAEFDSSATLLFEPGQANDVLRRIRLRALAAAAVESVGVGQRALDMARAYVTERKQFDKPIGAFQAVAHQVSDSYRDIELARSLAYWAAWCVAEDDEQAGPAALSAKAFASEVATEICERSIQVHGGIGFTWEHPLHRLYKRAQWLQAFEGFPREQHKELAQHLFS